MPDLSEVYGIAAEFAEPSDLLAAAKRAHAAGYRRMDAYTPIPVEGLYEALGRRTTRLPYLTLFGGLLGGLCGYALQYWVSVVEYPMNIGGRPLHSWPSFIPIVFETTVLGAALFSVFGMLALNGLPMPYHPLFNLPEFALASRNRFFLCIDKRDPLFDLSGTKAFMDTLAAQKVTVVPR